MFENEYLVNEKLINEYVYNFLEKKIIVLGYSITLIAFIIYVLMKENIMLVISLVSLITTIIQPITASKQLLENSKRFNNGKIEKTHIKFSDNIIMNEGKVHLEFEYSQIQKVLQTKNLIILKTSNQTAILVLKEGFLKGDKERFIEFINNKIN